MKKISIHSQTDKEKAIDTHRFDIIDVMRGIAVFLMFIYHFSYDLNYFGFIQENFYRDNFWIYFRTLIVSLFLIIVGISLYLSSYKKINIKRFRRRLILLVFYSLLVTIGSWIMYPEQIIFFGILHFITIASLLGLAFVHLGAFNLVLGGIFITLPHVIAHPFYDQTFLQWLGLMTYLPISVDYVPLLPWFGLVLIGIYFGQIMLYQKKMLLFQWQANQPVSKLLSLTGRHSLHIYILHQPLFLGILYIISRLIK